MAGGGSSREQRPVEQALAQHAEELGVRLDRVHHLLGVAARAIPRSPSGVARLEVGMALVVEVVHESAIAHTSSSAPNLRAYARTRSRRPACACGKSRWSTRRRVPGVFARRHGEQSENRFGRGTTSACATCAESKIGKEGRTMISVLIAVCRAGEQCAVPRSRSAPAIVGIIAAIPGAAGRYPDRRLRPRPTMVS